MWLLLNWWLVYMNEKSFKNQTYEEIDLILKSRVYPLIHQNLFLVFFPFDMENFWKFISFFFPTFSNTGLEV